MPPAAPAPSPPSPPEVAQLLRRLRWTVAALPVLTAAGGYIVSVLAAHLLGTLPADFWLLALGVAAPSWALLPERLLHRLPLPANRVWLWVWLGAALLVFLAPLFWSVRFLSLLALTVVVTQGMVWNLTAAYLPAE